MQTKKFRAFLTQTEELTPQQRKQTLEQIQKRCDIDSIERVLDSVGKQAKEDFPKNRSPY